MFLRINKISLAVIFVEYDKNKFKNTFGKLRQYLKGLNQCRVTFIRVDNKHEEQELTLIDENVYIIGGNNKYREFSGWQKGIEIIYSLNIPCNIVLFTNEAFLNPGESFLKDYSHTSLLRRSLINDAIIGRIDSLGKKIFVYGYDVSSWVCTNCFFAPKSAIDNLKDIVQVKDNLSDFVYDDYNSNHLVVDIEMSQNDMDKGQFVIRADHYCTGLCDFRITVDKCFNPNQAGLSEDNRNLSVYLTELSISGQGIYSGKMIRGFDNYPEDKWIGKTAVITVPVQEKGRFLLKGYIPPDVFRNIYKGRVRVRVYNDSCLFKEDAPISRNYQQRIIEWLTEHWYSRFEISAETWDKFKAKVSAILNEALLSAKFVEMGYILQTYGNKKYY
jgi:hypothetical protein